MKKQTSCTLLSCILMLSFLADCSRAQETQAPEKSEKARTYIIAPQDGSEVSSTFVVQFGLSGMGVAPAGSQIENTGHHHLLVDMDITDLPDLTKPLPSTDQVIHFGGGETQTMLTLPAGKHTLQLVLGDFAHRPHDPPVYSEKITIYVRD